VAKYSDNGKDPYTFPDSEVLRNLLGLEDQAQLDVMESSLVTYRTIELGLNPIDGKFDLAHLQAVHRYLFRDVYDWAGELRQVDISKGDTRFANAGYLQSAGQQLFRQLAKENNLRGLSPDDLSARLGHYLGEINVLHPFREGNGRTQREFIGQLARANGYRIDWESINQEKMVNASIEAYHGSSERLSGLIRSNLIDLGAESTAIEIGLSEPSLEEQLSAQEKMSPEMVEPSLEEQLEAQEPAKASQRYDDTDEPGMDM
jgi:cell filamentation protein